MRVVGMDVGSANIRVVEIDTAFGRYEIHDHHERALEPGVDPVHAVRELLAGLARKPDRLVLALPSRLSTFRSLSLPTRDRKAIAAGVAFELEDELPFPQDELHFDYSVLSQGRGGSIVHVAATLRKHVAARLVAAAETGFEPDALTTEAWALRALAGRVVATQRAGAPKGTAPSDVEPLLIAVLGHERTLLYGHSGGQPLLMRELAWGGRDLTLAICQKYAIPLDQAEKAKLDHGFVLAARESGTSPDGESVTPEQREFSDALLARMEPLVTELRQALLAVRGQAHAAPKRIHLAGGTALLPGLPAALESLLGTPVSLLPALTSCAKGAASGGVRYSEVTDASFALAAGLALTQVPAPDKASSINLRKGSFARTKESRELNWNALKRPLAYAAIVLGVFFSVKLAESVFYARKLKDLNSQLEKSVRNLYTAMGNPMSESVLRTQIKDKPRLRKGIDAELAKQRELARLLGPNPRSPLDYLKHLSNAIPKGVIVDLAQYQVGAAPEAPFSTTATLPVSLTFLVANPAVAESLKAAASSKIEGMQAAALTEVTTPDQRKVYQVVLTGNAAESAFGK